MIEINSKVDSLREIEWRKFGWLQNDTLKEMSIESFQRLKGSLVRNQFIQPFFVWKQGKKILDGKHRRLAMEEMDFDGFVDLDGEKVEIRIPKMLPAIFLNFETEKEAAKAVLAFSSKYAYETDEGVYEFMTKFDLKLEDIRNDIDLAEINWEKFDENFFKENKQEPAPLVIEPAVDAQYGVIVIANDEAEQKLILEKLTADGLTCKPTKRGFHL